MIQKREPAVPPRDPYAKRAPKRVKRASVAKIDGWLAIRAGIIERDGHRCRVCGADPVEARLDVHHIDHDRANNRDSNLVTLCHPCHRQVHAEGYRPDGTIPEPWGQAWPSQHVDG